MTSLPQVAIVLVNWNRVADTIECAESLLRSDYDNINIIICENGSHDTSWEDLKTWAAGNSEPYIPTSTDPYLSSLSFPNAPKPLDHQIFVENQSLEGESLGKVNLIQIKDNKGFSGGNNVGLRLALQDKNVEYFWVLNNDTVVERHTLEEYVSVFKEDEKIGMAGCVLRYYSHPEKIQALSGSEFNFWTGYSECIGNGLEEISAVEPAEVLKKANFISGASMLVSRAFLESVGLLEEKFKIYFEEIDWALRSQDEFKSAYAPKAVVFHKEGLTMTNRKEAVVVRSPASEYFFAKSRLKFAAKHFPFRLPVYWGALGLLIAKHIVRRRFKNIKPVLAVMLGIELYS